jgi:hypothetical protein
MIGECMRVYVINTYQWKRPGAVMILINSPVAEPVGPQPATELDLMPATFTSYLLRFLKNIPTKISYPPSETVTSKQNGNRMHCLLKHTYKTLPKQCIYVSYLTTLSLPRVYSAEWSDDKNDELETFGSKRLWLNGG